MSVKFQSETLQKAQEKITNVLDTAEAGKIPGTKGKHPVAAAVGTALDIEPMHTGDAVTRSGPARPVVRHMAIGAARMRKYRIDRRPRCKAVGRTGGMLRQGRARCRGGNGGSCQEALYRSHAKAVCFEIGSERTRLPVSADTALARAATAGGGPGSPTPPILCATKA